MGRGHKVAAPLRLGCVEGQTSFMGGVCSQGAVEKGQRGLEVFWMG